MSKTSSSNASEPAPSFIARLTEWQTLLKLLGFFIVTPAIALGGLALFVDERYAKWGC